MKNLSHRTRVSAMALSAALAGSLALPATAQQIRIDPSALDKLTNECRVLAENVSGMDGLPEGVDAEDTVEVINDNDAAACTDFYATYFEAEGGEADAEATERVEISEEALIEGLARVRVPAPEVDVEVPAPNVRVISGQPNVRIQEGQRTIEVQQEQPQIAVEIPEIRVRVEIPAPKLFIRSDDPSVEVASSDPKIEVQQEEPRVSVTQGEPEIGVDLEVETDGEATETASSGDAGETSEGEAGSGGEVRIARADPEVTIEAPEGDPQVEYAAAQPEVSFSGSEPNVTVSMSQEPSVEIARVGDIEVTFETAEEREQRRASSSGQSGEAEDGRRTVTIAELMDMPVIGANGEDLGSPEAFVRQGDELMLVLSHGGFIGLGDDEVAVPLSRVTFSEQGLQLQSLTEDELDEVADFTYDQNMVVDDELEIELGDQG